MDWLAPPIAFGLRSWRSSSAERSTIDQSIGTIIFVRPARITSVPVIDTMSICCALASCTVRRRAQMASVSSWWRIGISAGLFLAILALVAVLAFRLLLLFALGAPLGGARPHRLGLEGPVAHLEIGLEAPLALHLEQLLAV